MSIDLQSLRGQCLSMASTPLKSADATIEDAKKFEAYILGAVEPTDTPLSRIMEAAKTVDPRSVIGLK